jgi:hypothetical protein
MKEYEYISPNEDDVIWLRVKSDAIKKYIPAMGHGDMTWCTRGYLKEFDNEHGTMHPEHNRYSVNVPQHLFSLLNSEGRAEEEEKMYRFKTKEEFIQSNTWDFGYECPENWENSGKMNCYMGGPVPKKCNSNIKDKRGFTDGGWIFSHTDTVDISIHKPIVDEATMKEMVKIHQKVTEAELATFSQISSNIWDNRLQIRDNGLQITSDFSPMRNIN